MSRRIAAFTLIELMVVVAIIIVIVTMLLPSLAKAKEEAKLVKCGTNLHAIGVAIATYNAQNQDLMLESEAIYNVKPEDQPGNFALGDRSRGWIGPTGVNGILLSWPEKLYIDGAIDTGTGNKGGRMSARRTGDDPRNGGSWHYPICREPVFICPKHPEDQRRGDDPSQWGYGLAWCANADYKAIKDNSGRFIRYKLPVKARQLTSGHIVAVDGEIALGRDGGYNNPATNNYGVFQRHRRNQSKGANYLMADSSVVWSDLYASSCSPLNFQNDYSSTNRRIAAKLGFIWAHGRSMGSN